MAKNKQNEGEKEGKRKAKRREKEREERSDSLVQVDPKIIACCFAAVATTVSSAADW